MKIRNVTVDGYLGLPDRAFDLRDRGSSRPHDVVVVSGGPGTGKTRFLEAICAAKEDIAPWGARPIPDANIAKGESSSKITVDWVFEEEVAKNYGIEHGALTSESIFQRKSIMPHRHDPRLVAALSQYDHDPAHGKMEYFHDQRTLARGTLIMLPLDVGGHKNLRLSTDFRKYAFVEKTMLEICMGYYRDDGMGDLQRRLATFGVRRNLSRIERTPNGPSLLFEGDRQLGELSAMEQQAAIFACTAEAIGLEHSVVLVDTPELHVPDELAGHFAKAIVALGKNNQVIFATGSKGVVNTFPDALHVTLS